MSLYRALPIAAVLVLIRIPAQAVPGDVNGDGSITVADAAITSRLGPLDYVPPGAWYATADVAGPFGNYRDNALDWYDVTRLLRMAGGLEAIPDTPVDGLSRISDNITVTGDISKDYALQAVPSTPSTEYLVSGHISGYDSAHAVDSFWMPLEFYHFDESAGTSRFGAKPDASGDFKVLLSPNDYSLYSFGAVSETTEAGTLSWQYKTPFNREITVTGPMTVDVAAPSPPAHGQVSGTFQTTNLVPTRFYGSSSGDSDPSRSFLSATGAIGTDAYVLAGVPATYHFFVNAAYRDDPSITFDWDGADAVTMTGGSTVGPAITLPEVVPVTLRIEPPEGSNVASIELEYHSADGSRLRSYSQPAAGTGLVHTACPVGWSRVFAVLEMDGLGALRRTLGYSTQALIPVEGGEQTMDMPPLPTMFTFAGRVTLPDGSPASGMTVKMMQMGPDFDHPTRYVMSAEVVTDADGRFSVQLASGSYQVIAPW